MTAKSVLARQATPAKPNNLWRAAPIEGRTWPGAGPGRARTRPTARQNWPQPPNIILFGPNDGFCTIR